MFAMDWGGGGSDGRVARSQLVTGACFSTVALRGVTNLAPTALSLSLSLLYSLLHVSNILTWICFR
jgi:hypothetical protein